MHNSSSEQRINLSKDSYEFPGFISYCSDYKSELTFKPDECDAIIDLHKNIEPQAAGIGESDDIERTKDKLIRTATLYPIYPDKENEWLFKKVIEIVNTANDSYFQYNISYIPTPLSLLCYDSDGSTPGHYDWHRDAGGMSHATRKISMSVQLSDPDEYTECDLIVVDGVQNLAPRERGSVSLFPSYVMHRVNPIETGKRWSLVTWVHGQEPFK